MANTPSAYWPLSSLMRSLSRAGWGDLAGREYQGLRSTLSALAARLPDRSGSGLITAEQVAASAGLSERWVRRCLTVLEELGVIEWSRGGVIDGRPAPSLIKVVKGALVDLIHVARGKRSRAEAEHRAATAERIRAAHLTYTMRPKRKKKTAISRGSVHAELSTSLSTPNGGLPLGKSPRVNHLPQRNETMFANLSVTPEQERELVASLAHAKEIRRRRLVAEAEKEREATAAAISAYRAEHGAGKEYKDVVKGYALARFGKGRRA